MFRILFSATVLLIFTAAAAQAAENVPGSSCAGYPANAFQWAGAKENGGVLNGLFCNGGSNLFTGVINFQSTGKVGIGTTAPTTALQIGAVSTYNVRLDSSTSPLAVYWASESHPRVEIENNGSGSMYYGLVFNGSTGNQSQTAYGSAIGSPGLQQTLAFYTGNGTSLVEQMRINASGKVGIGTTTPGALLDVAGAIKLTDTAQNCSHATDTGAIRYNSSTFKLQSCKNGTGWTDVGAGATPAPAGSDKQIQYNNNGVMAASSGLVFSSTSGNVGIGTTSPGALLEVHGADALINNLTVGQGGGNVTNNTAVGTHALGANTASGSLNTAFGSYALDGNTTGGNNVAIGVDAIENGSASTYNVAVGDYTLQGNLSGSENAAVGSYALDSLTGGSYNVALGENAGYDVTIGNENILIGWQQTGGTGVTTGSNNILMGYDVRPPSQTANNQLNIGNLIYATGLGSGATLSSGRVGIGTTTPTATLNVVGTITQSGGNVIFGPSSQGTQIGTSAVYSGGDLNVGTYGVASQGAFVSTVAGTNTVYPGSGVFGANFIYSGYWAIRTDTSNDYNLDVYNSGTPKTAMTILQNGNVGIGTTTPAAKLDVVGDIHYSGIIVDVSDRRAKDNIQPLPSGQLAKLMQLQPVSFVMKADPKHRTELGLIAQDTEPLFPDLVLTDTNGMKSLNYVALVAPIIQGMQEQQAEINQLRAMLAVVLCAALFPTFLLWRNHRAAKMR